MFSNNKLDAIDEVAVSDDVDHIDPIALVLVSNEVVYLDLDHFTFEISVGKLSIEQSNKIVRGAFGDACQQIRFGFRLDRQI